LVQWKEFIVKYNIWEQEKNLGKISIKVQRQERLEVTRKQEFKREELLGKYIVKMLYR